MTELKKAALLSYVVLFLQNFVGLVYTPFLLRKLGMTEYGLYSIAASVVSYLAIFDFGFGNAIVRYTAKFKAEQKYNEQYNMFGMFLVIYLGICFFVLILGGLLSYNAEIFFQKSMTSLELHRVKILLFLMTFNLAITFPFNLFNAVIMAYEKFVFQKTIVICRIILNTVTMIVLLNLGYKAIAVIVVTTLFNLMTYLSNFIFCRRTLRIKINLFSFDFRFFKEISIFSLWNFLSVITTRLFWSSGQFILGAFSGPVVVATYAVAIQIQQIYSSFSTAINGVLLPRITSMVATNSTKKDISDMFVKIGRLQYCVLSLVLSGFLLFGDNFIVLWAGENYKNSFLIAVLFLIPQTVPLIQNVGITILQARNQLKFRSLAYLIVSTICLIAQIPLAKHFGMRGCAVAIFISILFSEVVVMNIYYYKKQSLDMLVFWKNITKMSFVPICYGSLSYHLLKSLQISSWFDFSLAVFAYSIVYIVLFYFLSMNTYEQNIVKNALTKIIKKF